MGFYVYTCIPILAIAHPAMESSECSSMYSMGIRAIHSAITFLEVRVRDLDY